MNRRLAALAALLAALVAIGTGALDALRAGAGERYVDLGEVNGPAFVDNVSVAVYAEALSQELVSNNPYRLGATLGSGTRPRLGSAQLGVADHGAAAAVPGSPPGAARSRGSGSCCASRPPPEPRPQRTIMLVMSTRAGRANLSQAPPSPQRR